MRQRKNFLQGQEKSKTIKTGIKRKKLNKSECIDRLSAEVNRYDLYFKYIFFNRRKDKEIRILKRREC